MRRDPNTNQSYLKLSFIIIFIWAALGINAHSQSSEIEMKALAFQKLCLFIDWPDHALDNPQNEFVIAVLGKSPFRNILERIYKNFKIKDKTVRIVYFKDPGQLSKCHLLFISKTDNHELIKILDMLKSQPILTVSDTEGFAEAGCFINFYHNSGRLRFEVNKNALESAGFGVDYRLLSVSKIVNTEIK